MNLRIRTRGIGAAATAETQHHAPTGGSRRGETATFGPNHLVVDSCLRLMPFNYSTFTMSQIRPPFSFPIDHELETVAVALVSLSALQVTDSSGVMPSGCPPARPRSPIIFQHKDPILIQSHHSDTTLSGILRLRFDDTTMLNSSYQRTRPQKRQNIFCISLPLLVCPLRDWLCLHLISLIRFTCAFPI